MDLEYKITTVAELAGAEAAADALERQIGKAKALKQDYSELQKELDTMRGSIAESKAAMENEGKETEKLRLGKRDLSEAIRGVTREYPMLGEVARAAFEPLVLAIFGIIEAFNIWKERIATLTEALGGIELPDLGDHIEEANNVATAYDGLAKAVGGANTQFNSAAGIFERQTTAANLQFAAIKALITAEKEKEIADLDIEKAGGKLTDTQYAARRARIETGASDATTQAEIAARDEEGQLKKAKIAKEREELLALQQREKTIKLPDSEEAAAAQAAEFDELAAARKKEKEDARKRGEDEQTRMSEMAKALDGSPMDTFRAIPDLLGSITKYGFSGDGDKLEFEASRRAGDQQSSAEKSSAEIKRKMRDRDTIRDEEKKLGESYSKDALSEQGQDDTNVVGSRAWQDAQSRNAQRLNEITDGEKQAAADLERHHKDMATVGEINSHATQTKADQTKLSNALKDAAESVKELHQIISSLSGLGADVDNLKKQVDQLKYSSNHF